MQGAVAFYSRFFISLFPALYNRSKNRYDETNDKGNG